MNYKGKEIIGDLLTWSETEKFVNIPGGVKYLQKIEVKCSVCEKTKTVVYKNHRNIMLKRLKKDPEHQYMCMKCAARKFLTQMCKGKTFEEIYGFEKAQELKKKFSTNSLGKKNGMYGKPSPMGSGNGWSGWYNGWYFRSLRELSFMINYIERFNFKWETREKKKDAIKYIDWKKSKRNYFPDFLINNKYIVEIKPKKMWNSIDVKQKTAAAVKYCKKNNLIYKLIDPQLLKEEQIINLYLTKKITLLPRYEEKLKQKYINI